MTSFSPDQDVMFITSDEAFNSTPWRKTKFVRRTKFERGGVLTTEQVQEVAQQFQIDLDVVESMSNYLEFCLDTEANPLVIHMSREIAAKRASTEIAKALAETAVAAQKLKQASERLNKLYTGGSLSADGAQRLETLKLVVVDTHRHAAEAYQELGSLAKLPNVALVLAYTNRGPIRDLRRKCVIHFLFQLWVGAGRKLTWTGDVGVEGAGRSGALIDFVNAVVVCITDPPTSLSGHTIVSDLRAYQSLSPKCESDGD